MLNSMKGSILNFINHINLCGQASHNPRTPERYKIGSRFIQEETLLSEGGYGYVWKAFDTKTKEVFAVKKMLCQSPESLCLAQKELDILKNTPIHQNIVRFYDGLIVSFEIKEVKMAIFVFELCQEGSLLDYIIKRKDRPLDEPTIIAILSQINKALVHLHSQKPPIAHRDLKLENILIKDNTFKLCDFGSSSTVQVDFSQINKNDFYQYEEVYEKNTTLMYRPPEMIELYLRFAVTEKHPFQEATKLSIINAGYYMPKHSYSQGLMDLLSLLLTPNPVRRPTSMKLDEILKDYKVFGTLNIKPEWIENRESLGLNNKIIENKTIIDKPRKNTNKSKKSLKEPLVDFTNEWGDFVQAGTKNTKNNNEFMFNFDDFENKPPGNNDNNNNQWGGSGGSFMNAFKINMPVSPRMEDMDERKPADNIHIANVPYHGLEDKKKITATTKINT